MTTATLLALIMSALGVLAYAQYRFPKQPRLMKTSTNEESNSKPALPVLLTAANLEQASHNLEYCDQPQRVEHYPPTQHVLDADFAAEAHGFTGFEAAGRGSRYKSSV